VEKNENFIKNIKYNMKDEHFKAIKKSFKNQNLDKIKGNKDLYAE